MAGKIKDISGKRFGRLIAMSVDKEKSSYGKTYWNCICDCGQGKSVIVSALIRGATRSCGCLHLETACANGQRPKTHGLTHHRLFKIWGNMHERCRNTNNHAFPRYGNRGITVCSEWGKFMPFYMWAQNNGYKPWLTIDRVDNNGGYSPDNCRWSTPKEQANNMRNNVRLVHRGEEKTLSEWGDVTSIKPHTIRKRIYELGWPIDEALERVPSYHKRAITFERCDKPQCGAKYESEDER